MTSKFDVRRQNLMWVPNWVKNDHFSLSNLGYFFSLMVNSNIPINYIITRVFFMTLKLVKLALKGINKKI